MCGYDSGVARETDDRREDDFEDDDEAEVSAPIDHDPLPQDMDDDRVPLEAETVRCAKCRKYIWAYAIRCPKCGTHFNGEAWQFAPSSDARPNAFPLWIVVTATILLALIFIALAFGVRWW